MGRLSKYKKVKSTNLFDSENDTLEGAVWGFGNSGRKKKKRSRTAQAMKNKKLKRKRERGGEDDDGFDLPPSQDDEFNLSDFNVKKQRLASLDDGLVERHQEKTSAGLRCVIPETEKEAAKMARSLKIDKSPQQKKSTQQGRMEGESNNAFNRRVKNETRQIIKREARDERNPEKRRKKKDFLNNKKKKKGPLKQSEQVSFDGESSGEAFEGQLVTGEQAAATARVAFGEQAERPPVFNQLPRGASIKSRRAEKKARHGSMSDSQIDAERKAMESMRKKVQAQYAIIKAKRKKAGDFHL